MGHLTFQVSFGTGFGIFTPMVVDGKDHIFGGQGLTVVKFYALAQLEGPDFGIRCRYRLGSINKSKIDRPMLPIGCIS